MSELYTASRLRVLRRCLKEHELRYKLGLISPSGPQAVFGNNGHKALEHYLLAWKSCRPADERLEHGLAVVASVPDPVERAKLRALMVNYHLRWGAEPWEIVAVEVEFRFQLGGYRIGGKIDGLVRNLVDGRVYVLEHKTTGSDTSAGSTYWDKLSIDTQVSVYVDGAAVLGHDVAGCIYDVLVRPDHERLLATPEEKREYTKGKGCKVCGGKAGAKGRGHLDTEPIPSDCDACKATGWEEPPRLYAKQREHDETIDAFAERVMAEVSAAPEKFLIRGDVVRLADELPRMRLDLMQAIWIAEEAEKQGVAPRNTDACVRYRQMCPYFDACSGRADVNDTNRFPRGAIHVELAPNP